MVIECNEISNNYVYQHRRLDTNEIFYVGIGKGMNFRRSRNKSTRNNLWKKIVNKTEYKIEIVSENLTRKESIQIEQYLIKYYGRIDLNNGSLSNFTDGGDGGQLNMSEKRKNQLSKQSKNRIWSEESRKKLSNSRLNKPLSEYQLFKIREASLKRRGQKLSKETKLKMSNNSYKCREVIDISTNIIYKSATEVSKKFNINLGTLCCYLRGSRTNKTNFKYLNI